MRMMPLPAAVSLLQMRMTRSNPWDALASPLSPFWRLDAKGGEVVLVGSPGFARVGISIIELFICVLYAYAMYLNFSAYVFVANYVFYVYVMCETYWYYLSSVYGFHNDQDYLWYSIYMVKAMYQMVWYDFQTLRSEERRVGKEC